ncbi:MAG: MarR family transcriptional regulator [Xanthomonadaceae bacterium]|nr:MarR family transcriptional regulator [Xanthomonadaceae bacterium]
MRVDRITVTDDGNMPAMNVSIEEQTRTPRSLDSFLRTGYLIHDVSRLRRVFYDQRSRHLGITRAQWWVLFNLGRTSGPALNQHELAQRLDIGSASLGELLQRLERGGFIRRVQVPGDRRSKRIQIAEHGREVLKHMRMVAETSHGMIMNGISPDEQQTLDELLSRMRHNLSRSIADEQARTDVGSRMPTAGDLP